MAALAKDRNTPRRDGEFIRAPVKAATKIYAGSLVFMNAGVAEPATKAADLIALGRAEELADNSSGIAGAISVLVRRGVFRWANSAATTDKVAAAEIGKKAYAADDQTVTKVATAATAAGIVLGVDSEGVWVETR